MNRSCCAAVHRSSVGRTALVGIVSIAVFAAGGIAAASDGVLLFGAGASPGAGVEGDPSVFVGIEPVRILDTRVPVGVPARAPLGPDQTISLKIAGVAGVPLDATTAAMNVTIDSDATAPSFLTIWPSGRPRPLTSANNSVPGLVTPNEMQAALGADGSVDIYNYRGRTNVVIDLVGYYRPLSSVIGDMGGQLLVGSGAPAADLGSVGDVYIDSSTSQLYGPKTDTGWGTPTTLGTPGPQGPPGATGPEGPAGVAGPVGPQGPAGALIRVGAGTPAAAAGNIGDVYLDTVSGQLFGPKSAGGWGTAVGSFIGPQGPAGSTGPAGPQGATGAMGPQGVVGATGPEGPIGATGATGATGAQGPAGVDGRSVLNGVGVPSLVVGSVGDFYIDTTASQIYGPKSVAGWGSPVSLVGPQGETGPIGPTGGTGATGATGPAGPGAQTGTTTPTAGTACAPNGLVNINTSTGELSVCVLGQWGSVVSLRSAIDGAASYADSGVSATSISLDGTFRTVASFTATSAGTYILVGSATISQASVIALQAPANIQCAWFDSTGSTQRGPESGSSVLAQTVLGTAVQGNVQPMAQVVLGAAAQVTLRCRFTGTTLGLGGFAASSWSYTATRTG